MSDSTRHRTRSQFFKFTCSSCGLTYSLHADISYIDTGRCVSCDREIEWMEEHIMRPSLRIEQPGEALR